ncbi:MAG: tRNA (adenosine(37)-N6)-threonylcarbamoyltransferase complex ATPase subunit type 1 TsaE [Propionibacteriaceae bacterium]
MSTSADCATAQDESRAALPLAEIDVPDGRTLYLRTAVPEDAPEIVTVVHAAFRARRPVDPPPTALLESDETIAATITEGEVVIAVLDDRIVGTIMIDFTGEQLPENHDPDAGPPPALLERVSVDPNAQGLGIASAMVLVTLDLLALQGCRQVALFVRQEFPEIRRWWERHGFVFTEDHQRSWVLRRAVPLLVEVPTADAMQALGERLAGVLRSGDVLIATGDLGAGKTTLTQGIGRGLAVSGPVISPTFVLSRIHPSMVGGPALVHVDAYRLGSSAEVLDLDLEASLSDSVTLVEWGAGVAEGLADDRLEIDIRRGADPSDDTRWVSLTPVGPRWTSVRAELEEAVL